MGLFSFLDTKKFRTGGTRAAKDAKLAGEATLAEQQALKQEIGSIYEHRIQTGGRAFGDLTGFYEGDQQTIVDQAMASPFRSQLINTGEEAIARNTQMTGGFRTGTTQENLANNSQNVLMNLVQQILQGKQGIAQRGFGAEDAYTNAMQNIVAGTGATRGEIAGVDIARAANKQNIYTGLVEAGSQAAMAASDERLKENVVKIGEKNGLNWYSWDWNKLAKGIGLTGSDKGHIAQEVQKVRPDLVVEQNGYLAVIYGGF